MADRGGPVAGVLLAAGASRRMGFDKLRVRMGGVSLLRRAASTALAAGLDPLLVVVGPDPPAAQAELDGLAVRLVENPRHAEGINGSLRAGVRAVPAEAPGAVVLLADMPFVTPEMVAALVSRFLATAAPLVVSRYGEVLAPPTLYGRDLFPELQELAGEGCGKRVMQRHRAEAEALDWPEGALVDVDEPDDLEPARRRLEV